MFGGGMTTLKVSRPRRGFAGGANTPARSQRRYIFASTSAGLYGFAVFGLVLDIFTNQRTLPIPVRPFNSNHDGGLV